MSEEKQPFSAKEWILAMLYAGGGRIKGKTRLQKGIFIISQEVNTIETTSEEPSIN